MSGANSTRGVLLSSNTITPVSDNSNENLVLRGKGTGGVVLGGGSTSAIVGIVVGESTVTLPALAANAQGESTFTATGISTGDLILSVDFRNEGSTKYVFGSAYVGAADKIHVHTGNVHASTISASTGTTVRWAYLDRT
jgi:hypothetical protein